MKNHGHDKQAAARGEAPSILHFPRDAKQIQGEIILAAARGAVGSPSADHLPGSQLAPASIRLNASTLDVGAFVNLMRSLPKAEAIDLCKRCMV